MALKLKTGDRFLAEITSVSAGRVLADPGEWANVSEILVKPAVSTTVLTPGREMVVRVTQIDSDTAQVTQQRSPPYKRQHSPGDTLTARAGGLLQSDVCEGEPESARNLNRLLLLGAYPNDAVKATIHKIRNGLAFASVTETLSTGIRSGSRLEVQTVAGERYGTTLPESYDVKLDRYSNTSTRIVAKVTDIGEDINATVEKYGDLPHTGRKVPAVTQPGKNEVVTENGRYHITVDEEFYVKTQVLVEITEIDGPEVYGQISDPNQLPYLGVEIVARAKRDQEKARVQDGDYQVQLKEQPLASGTIRIRITTREDPPQAELVSYEDAIPKVGDTVKAFVSRRDKTARPSDYDFPLCLEGDIQGTGYATVRITNVGDDQVTGRIVEYNSSNNDEAEDIVGSKNSLISGRSL